MLLAPDVSEPFSQAILERLQPLALWGSGFCAQTLLLLVLIRHGPDKKHLYPLGRIVGWILLAVGLLFLSWNLVVDTAFSVESRIRGWNELGTPIIETQVLLGWTIGMMLLAVFYFLNQLPGTCRLKRYLSPRTADILVALLLWGVTVLLWNSVPLAPSWFVSEPRDANFEFYPNSDALKYDLTSQGLLVGEDLQFIDTPYIRRPVHALLLAALHLVGGQDYMTVTTLQIMVLALIPVLVYLLVRLLHNRVSGAVAGVLIMLREANSIAIAESVTTSHARLLMSDLPAALFLIALVYVLVLWLRNPASHRLLPVLAGGLLGACVLIRPEMGALLLPILVVILISFWTKRQQIIRSASLILLGAALIISPWVFRNWQTTGMVFLDSPVFRFNLIADRYRPSSELAVSDTPLEEAVQPTADPTQPPVVTQDPAVATSVPEVDPFTPYVASTIDRTMSFIKENSAEVGKFLFANTMNSQMQVVLVLPATYRIFDSAIQFIGHRDTSQFWDDCCSLSSYVRRLPFWHKWEGTIPGQAVIPIILNVSLMVTGILTGWKNQRWIGLLPLLIGITYISTNALVRNSGGRFILPVDWIGIAYFSVGLMQISIKAASMVAGRDLFSSNIWLTVAPVSPHRQSQRPDLRSPAFYTLCIGLLLLGSLLPVLEKTIPSPYPEIRKAELISNLLDSDQLTDHERVLLWDLLGAGGQAYLGRALFPRFYPAGEGEPGTANAMGPLDYRRLGFYLLGPDPTPVLLPMDKKPLYFPNASDVLVIFDQDQEPVAVGVYNGSDEPIVVLWSSQIREHN